ncbi:MAG: DNA gyrase C-terminal beta-propeller domain-containing protein, partial [Bacillota bacterium]|nr:DNA gyrase C-terminal beta-propeller domain-containing protein [Bacillota bacterium]
AVKSVKEFDDRYIVLITKKGIIKRLKLKDLDTTRKTGIYAINFRENNDELVSVRITDGSQDVLIATKNGKAIRFNEDQVRVMGRTAYGVIGIHLEENDEVMSMVLVNDNATLLAVTENGYGKRTNLSEYRPQTRGGKGMLTYNINKKTGQMIDILIVDENDEIMIINTDSIVIRLKVDAISVIGRNTSGVILMKTEENSKVVSLAKTIEIKE